MLNIYHAFVVNPGKHPAVRRAEAQQFVRFLADPATQAWIGEFGRAKLGASMAVGGNLRGSTRVLTTAIVTETGRGDIPVAMALGLLLLGLALAVNLLLTLAQQRQR